MIVYIGDLRFERGMLTPAASWSRVAWPEAEAPEEVALNFGECEGCGATIGAGEPMRCEECAAS